MSRYPFGLRFCLDQWPDLETRSPWCAGDKINRWIANFLTDRSIYIHWKSVFLDCGPSKRGALHGSVLSPFFFMIVLFHFFEILECGVDLLIYTDDIFMSWGRILSTLWLNSRIPLTGWLSCALASIFPFHRRTLTLISLAVGLLIQQSFLGT